MQGNRHTHASSKLINICLAIVMLVVLVAGSASYGASQASAQTQSGGTFTLSSVVATTTNVNLREQPAASGAPIATMPTNARAIVIGGPFNDNWYWLDYSGTKGYASGKYLVIVDSNYVPVSTETPTVVATATVATSATATTGAATGTATATSVLGTATKTATAGAAGTKTPTAGVGTPAASATPDPAVATKPGDYTNLWIGEMAYAGNVRSGPGTDKPIVKGWWVGRRVLLYQQATDSKGDVWYRVSETPEDPMWVHSSLVRKLMPVKFEGALYKGKWVNVNITQQVVTAYENGTPVKVTLASTGKAPNTTELGVWKIYWRLPKQDMKGGNKASGDFYDLKDVPYPQYFHISGEALHGTYWHDDFGKPHSHGCVNLSTPISQWFYGWDTIGTVVYVHN